MNKPFVGILCGLLCMLTACGTRSIVVKPDYDFSQIQRVAVLEFRDAPYYPVTSGNSGSMVSELFVKYLLQTGYNVVERNELESILREQNLAATGVLNREQIKAIGRISGIDAIITGSISTFVPERHYYENGYPRYEAAQVGVTCRMISVETGEILWAGSDTYDGMNTQTAFDYLVESLVSQLMKTLTAQSTLKK